MANQILSNEQVETIVEWTVRDNGAKLGYARVTGFGHKIHVAPVQQTVDASGAYRPVEALRPVCGSENRKSYPNRMVVDSPVSCSKCEKYAASVAY